MPKQRSLKEIAEACEVSLSTAYRVVRGEDRKTDGKHRILRRMLSENGHLDATCAEGPYLLIASGSMSSHALALYNMVQKLCADRGVELGFTLDTTFELERRRRNYAGMIALTPIPRTELPCVYLNMRSPSGNDSAVFIDRFAAHLTVFDGLVRRGFKRIGLFGSLVQQGVAQYIKHGLLPEAQLYEYADVAFHPELVCPSKISATTHEEGCRAVAEYFAGLEVRPDALVLFDDTYAWRVIRRLRELGVRVPEDIAIATLGDSLCHPMPSGSEMEINLAEDCLARPGLPVIDAHLPLQAMAECALELLQRHVEDETYHVRHVGFSVDFENNLGKGCEK